jgi:hypothetical protein
MVGNLSNTPSDERVKAGVVVIGCPDYRLLMLQRAGQQEREARLPHAFLGLVSKLGPRPDILSRKDLLILKGDDDQLVPWSASQGFVSQLPPEKAQVIGFPGVGHAFTDEMRSKSAEWIVDWRRKHWPFRVRERGGVVKLKVLIKDRLLSQISNKFPPNMFQRVDVESSSVTQISTS